MFFIACIFLIISTGNCVLFKQVCYYTNWAQYRQGSAKYDISLHYSSGLCTHIIYAFAKIELLATNTFGIAPYEWNDQSDGYIKVNNLKIKEPQLKTLLSVGGWNHASSGFTDLVKTYTSRSLFIQNVISYLNNYGFDGLDIDWEYPGQRGSPPEDKQLFTLLCKEINAAFNSYGLLITASVAAGQSSASISYEIAEISSYLDFINLMTYDLHGSWESTVGHHTDSGLKSTPLSVYNSVNYWITNGAPPSKLILGLASYGRTWRLTNSCNWNLGASGNGGGAPGQFTLESGFLSYYEICKKKWSSKICTLDSLVNAPYASDAIDFIGYDDEESITYKVVNIVKKKLLGGFMFWALDLDDFNGLCNNTTYPLLKAAKKAVENEILINQTKCKSSFGENCTPLLSSSLPSTAISKKGKCRFNTNILNPWIEQRVAYEVWCSNEYNCPNYCGQTDCPTCMCNCNDESNITTTAKASTIATTKFKLRTTLKSTTKKDVSTTPKQATTTTSSTFIEMCEMPPADKRINCLSNPFGPFKNTPGMNFWCSLNCPGNPNCPETLCCCNTIK